LLRIANHHFANPPQRKFKSSNFPFLLDAAPMAS
jgi:hypothetical protein